MTDPRTARNKVKPSLAPQNVRPDVWFYESRGSLHVVAVKDGVTTIAKIPWGQIMKSARRCGWKVSRV